MTSAPINDYPALQSYQSVKSTDGAGTVGAEAAESFRDAMKQAGEGRTKTSPEAAGQNQTDGRNQAAGSMTRTADALTGRTQSQNGRVHSAETSEKTDCGSETKQTEEVKETVEEVAEETEKEVISEVADELDVTEEEVKAAMEALGLTVMDLKDQTNMAALVTLLTGENDPAALLTDENLFAAIRQLTAEVGEIIDQNAGRLSEELGVDMDEALGMIQASMEAEPEQVQPQVVVEVIHDLPGEEKQAVNTDTTGDQETEKTEIAEAAVTETETEQQTGQNRGTMDFHRESSPLVNQMFDARTVQTGEISQVELPFQSHVNTADIINQIGEYVKIHQSQGLSEMEISLNPESLGHIHLQVASREGVITATIATQNEAVREALMVQAMVLKEELNQQGIKVEAVEVTVASHEFERDMKNGGEEAKNLFERQVQKQARRRIVIDSLKQAEEMLEIEDLTDAERLQIDMMAKSGNSVDFTA